MKIPLHVGQGGAGAGPERLREQDVLLWKDGDWEAKARVIHAFMPLLSTLARKHASDPAGINRCIEAGKEGLQEAMRKYTKTGSADKFQLFAVDFIEARMSPDEKKGFLARLFGR